MKDTTHDIRQFPAARKRMQAILLMCAGCHLALSAVASAQVTWIWRTFAGVPGQGGSTDSPGPQARFSQPRGIVMDVSGNAYVVDSTNHAVRKVTAQGVVTTVAGSGTAGYLDATGNSARFSSPRGVALDAGGNLYIADRGNNRIRKILPSGEVGTLAGQAAPGGNDATGAAASFSSPSGVAVDSSGNVYVADSANHTIRRITPGGAVTTLAGQSGSSGTTNGTGTAARFNTPESIALHPDGSLLVTEFNNHSIRRVTMSGVVTTFAGQVGTPGSSGGTTATASFRFPTGITVTPDGTVYVADGDNHTVRRIRPTGQIDNLAGQPGMSGSVDGLGPVARFNKPYGVAVTPVGAILVADTDNNALRHMTTLGQVSVFAGQTGAGAFVNSAASPGMLRYPTGIAADVSGYILVADYQNSCIRRISPAGVISTFAGNPGVAGHNDGTGTATRFNTPRGLTLDPAGNIYVADTGNHTIRKITPSGVVTTLAGFPGTPGYQNLTGSDARFREPTTLDWQGTYNVLLIADMGNSVVRELNPTTMAVSTFAGVPGVTGGNTGPRNQATFSSLYGISITPGLEIFMANRGGRTISRITGSYANVDTIGGQYGVQGSNDGPLGTSRFNIPSGIDSDGFTIIISDIGDHTIRTMLPGSPHTTTTIGGRPGRYDLRDGVGQAALFNTPVGVVKAPNGDLYVADSGNHRVVHGKAYASPWAGWLAFHNISSGATGDEDKDGMVNLLEFAFGTHPRDGRGGIATASGGVVTARGTPSVIKDTDGSYLGLYAVRLDSHQISLRYTPEFSSDLTDWTPHTGVIPSRGLDEEVNLLSARFPATLPNGKVPRFFRVVVSQM